TIHLYTIDAGMPTVQDSPCAVRLIESQPLHGEGRRAGRGGRLGDAHELRTRRCEVDGRLDAAGRTLGHLRPRGTVGRDLDLVAARIARSRRWTRGTAAPAAAARGRTGHDLAFDRHHVARHD